MWEAQVGRRTFVFRLCVYDKLIAPIHRYLSRVTSAPAPLTSHLPRNVVDGSHLTRVQVCNAQTEESCKAWQRSRLSLAWKVSSL
jgi:hypothetical protein